MANLFNLCRGGITLGGERIEWELERTISSLTEKVADVVRTLTAAAATSAPTLLWQDSAGTNGATQHAVATNPLVSPFTCGLLMLDPDAAQSAAYSVSVELAATRHNSTSIDLRTYRVSKAMPLFIPSSIISNAYTSDVTTGFADIDLADANYPRITRIRAHNPNATPDLTVRLLLFK